MKAITMIFVVAAALISNTSQSASIVPGRQVKFGPDEQYTGYFVRPAGNGPVPGMVVIHEWWGVNDYIRSQADKLAQEGYAALAVDLFGKVTTNPDEARQMVQNLNQQEATARLLAAGGYLRALPYVPDDKVGSIGWCFGGGQSLRLALSDPKLAAAVIYYGQPVTDPKELSKIKAAVLGIYGENDQQIPPAQAKAFDQALTEAGVRHAIYTYPGAGHAFANPSRGENYKPLAADDAWKKTTEFLGKYLKK